MNYKGCISRSQTTVRYVEAVQQIEAYLGTLLEERLREFSELLDSVCHRGT